MLPLLNVIIIISSGIVWVPNYLLQTVCRPKPVLDTYSVGKLNFGFVEPPA